MGANTPLLFLSREYGIDAVPYSKTNHAEYHIESRSITFIVFEAGKQQKAMVEEPAIIAFP